MKYGNRHYYEVNCKVFIIRSSLDSLQQDTDFCKFYGNFGEEALDIFEFSVWNCLIRRNKKTTCSILLKFTLQRDLVFKIIKNKRILKSTKFWPIDHCCCFLSGICLHGETRWNRNLNYKSRILMVHVETFDIGKTFSNRLIKVPPSLTI